MTTRRYHRDNQGVEIRNYLRSARGPQDAAKAYQIVASECERNLTAVGIAFAFRPWTEVAKRAQSRPDCVAQVQGIAERLRAGVPLRDADSEAADATAVAMAYGYCVRALDLTPAVASLAAGWCWLQCAESRGDFPG